MFLSNRVVAPCSRTAAPLSTPIGILLVMAVLLCAPATAFAQQNGSGGFFGSLFGNSSGPKPYSSRGSYNDRSSYDNSWLGSWSNSYASESGGISRYRTLCVRTCDGYYFPISYSTTRSGLARDAQQCEARCGAPAKLFYHRNPGADVEHMVDLNGARYSSLENAFRYRREVVDSCRCTPQPWSEAAKQEYESRAEAGNAPGTVSTAQNATDAQPDTQDAATARAEVAGWRIDADERAAQRERVRRRPRYRENDPSHDGRWWAGSW